MPAVFPDYPAPVVRNAERELCRDTRDQYPKHPLASPRQKTDWPNTKQTDEPWKGNPEKEQLDPVRPDIDHEKWQESNTH